MARPDSSTAPVVMLPACTFPSEDAAPERQADLLHNLAYLREHMPHCRILVCDNGVRLPDVPEGVELIHDLSARSTDPSLGECLNLLAGLKTLADDTLVIKMHTRCTLENIGAFKKFWAERREFLLVSPNVWGKEAGGYDEMPYCETRVFALRAGIMRRLLTETLALLEANGGRIEQALLSVILRDPKDAALATTRGPFFPVMGGTSGHGRQYGSLLGKARSKVKAGIYRFGF